MCFLFTIAVIPADIVHPCRTYLGPYTKDEHAKYQSLQNGLRMNRVMSALGLDIPVRVHPEIVPDSGKKKKKNAARKSSSDEDDAEVEENEENTDNEGNDGPEELGENEENEGNESGEDSSNSDDDSSDSSSDDSDSSSDEEIASAVPPAQAASSVLKRKIGPSGSLPGPSSKRIQIVVDSDDELDEEDVLVDVCAINVTPLQADASLVVPASIVAPLDVLASAATVIEKDAAVKPVQTADSSGFVFDDDKIPAAGLQTSALVAQDLETGKKVEETVRTDQTEEKNDEAHSPPFLSTPSPQLIQDILGGFSDRCAKNGRWLMGLPNFSDLGDNSHLGSNFCINDLKYRHPLGSVGEELEKVLITPELEKEFMEENDLMSSWAALDVSAAQVCFAYFYFELNFSVVFSIYIYIYIFCYGDNYLSFLVFSDFYYRSTSTWRCHESSCSNMCPAEEIARTHSQTREGSRTSPLQIRVCLR